MSQSLCYCRRLKKNYYSRLKEICHGEKFLATHKVGRQWEVMRQHHNLIHSDMASSSIFASIIFHLLWILRINLHQLLASASLLKVFHWQILIFLSSVNLWRFIWSIWCWTWRKLSSVYVDFSKDFDCIVGWLDRSYSYHVLVLIGC